MKIEHFIKDHSFDDVMIIEENDKQLSVIRDAWTAIQQQDVELGLASHVFLYLILQTALISYQIAGSGPKWRGEITTRISDDFDFHYRQLCQGLSNTDWRLDTMLSSQYNKRLYNLKKGRLDKFFDHYHSDFDIGKFDYYEKYQDMELLLVKLTRTMKQKKTNKTMTFAVKMFGYAARCVYGELVYYPMSIKIPLDSRLRKIGQRELGELSDIELQDWFQDLSEKHKIPPLHLDSLLWLKYWERFGGKSSSR